MIYMMYILLLILCQGVAQKKFEREAEIPSYFPQQKMRKVNQFQSNFNQSLYLRIKNLDETIDDTQLREVFECYGAITSATVKKDENGNSNGLSIFFYEIFYDIFTVGFLFAIIRCC